MELCRRSNFTLYIGTYVMIVVCPVVKSLWRYVTRNGKWRKTCVNLRTVRLLVLHPEKLFRSSRHHHQLATRIHRSSCSRGKLANALVSCPWSPLGFCPQLACQKPVMVLMKFDLQFLNKRIMDSK